MKLNLTRSATLAIAVLVVLVMAVPSRADTVFTNRTLFNTAVGASQTTIDFTLPGPFPHQSLQLTAPYTTFGVTFTGQNLRDVSIIDGDNVGLPAGTEVVLTTYCNPTNHPGCNTNVAQDSLTLTLPAGTTAIGFDIKDGNSGAPTGIQDVYQVTDSNGTSILVSNVGFPNFAFVGFQISGLSTSIASVTIKRLTISPNGEAVIDNVSFAPPVPEPSTLAMFGSGLVAVGSLLRRRLGQK